MEWCCVVLSYEMKTFQLGKTYREHGMSERGWNNRVVWEITKESSQTQEANKARASGSPSGRDPLRPCLLNVYQLQGLLKDTLRQTELLRRCSEQVSYSKKDIELPPGCTLHSKFPACVAYHPSSVCFQWSSCLYVISVPVRNPLHICKSPQWNLLVQQFRPLQNPYSGLLLLPSLGWIDIYF